MQKYIFFTKSMWSEPPRLRHQMANLVRSFGGDVLFFEKPIQFGKALKRRAIVDVEKGLQVVRTREFIHHQLRVVSILNRMDALLERMDIHKVISDMDVRDSVVVNFNYDYYFLRELFPNNKIITIINDDFVAQGKFFEGRHIHKTLGKTCRMSDAVLVVSYPLHDQVSEWVEPHLFFPWADRDYKTPVRGVVRDSVLLWAHINSRIDFDLLKEVAARLPNVNFHVVGPIANNALDGVRQLQSSGLNFSFTDSAKLDDLPIDRYFCSIIPYVKGVKDIEAVTMSNKTLQLLARGLPIVTHGMPHFFSNESIIKSDSVDSFVSGVGYCSEHFFSLQGSIKEFVSNNQAFNRFQQLRNIISEGANV